MRIGLITGEYPPMEGGVGDFTAQLAQALAALGHDVHVLTGRSEGPVANRFRVHRTIENWKWGCWKQILQVAGEAELEVLNVQYQAAAYGMHPAINFLPRHPHRPPVAVTFHDLKVPYLFPKAGPLRWQVVRMLALRADGVIVTNREDYLRLQPELPTQRLNLIPIGSNIPATPPPGYDRAAERARWGVGAGDLLLGYFGFLNESKGVEDLVRGCLLYTSDAADER
ncbi:MAG: glycosyltransferase, partial [Anaerolineae bacterium]|nr:glycosyltransferase [Anaerolineae bacterium]